MLQIHIPRDPLRRDDHDGHIDGLLHHRLQHSHHVLHLERPEHDLRTSDLDRSLNIVRLPPPHNSLLYITPSTPTLYPPACPLLTPLNPP